MDNEDVLANEPEEEPEVDKGSQSTIDWALNVMENTELVTGHIRQVVDGGLLGTCIVFFAAMLGIQHIDTSLTIASAAFAAAIPQLVWGIFCASYKAKPTPGWLVLKAIL